MLTYTSEEISIILSQEYAYMRYSDIQQGLADT